MNPDCQTTVMGMVIPAASFPNLAFVHLLKLLCLLQAWNGELFSPKKNPK